MSEKDQKPGSEEYDSEEALTQAASDFEQAIKAAIEELGERLTPMVATAVLATIASEFLVKLGVSQQDARAFFRDNESRVRVLIGDGQ